MYGVKLKMFYSIICILIVILIVILKKLTMLGHVYMSHHSHNFVDDTSINGHTKVVSKLKTKFFGVVKTGDKIKLPLCAFMFPFHGCESA